MHEPETLTVYLEADGDVIGIADQLRAAAAELPGVDAADLEVEDVERAPVETLQTITLTLTAVGGAVGATNLLLGELTKLVKAVKGIRAAWRDSENGPIQIDVSDATETKNGRTVTELGDHDRAGDAHVRGDP